MHHKVIVLDGEIVITGSYNFTQSAENKNDEDLLIIWNAGWAALYEKEFHRIYDLAVQKAATAMRTGRVKISSEIGHSFRIEFGPFLCGI
jgi:phosphatidylserine/phosphatidylglycerophosphate/cardiolipin synthase-like enzyme